MADIFDEISQDLKKDRQSVLWQRYGKYVIGAVVVIILLIGARQGYVYWAELRDNKAANSFYKAAKAEDADQALALIGSDLTDGYQMLSSFVTANTLSQNGQAVAAEQAYLDLSVRADIAPIYKDLALLLSVMHAPNSADAGDLIQRLDPLLQTANPLQGLALEQAAAIDMKRGQMKDAADRLIFIGTLNNISDSLRQRAAQILKIIAPDNA